MKIKRIVCTCHASPSLWEAYTEEDEAVYIRYRWGLLEIRVSKPGETIADAIYNGKVVFSKQIGDKLDGMIEKEDVLEILEDDC